jgi:hypothetical protein
MVRRTSTSAFTFAFIALAVGPGTAVAARSFKPQLGPAAPTLKTPITVRWKARSPKRGISYVARLSVRNPADLNCTSYADDVALRPTRSGYAGTLTPQGGSPALPTGTPQWCPGSALVTILRLGPGSLYSSVLTGARITVGLAPGETRPAERPGVPVKVTVLPGSTITATADGRPDRSSPVTGTLRGEIPGRFKPNTNITVGKWSGALAPTSLAADPLCPGVSAPASADIVAASNMVLFASGVAQFDLTLNTGASQLFGCGPAGAPTGTTTFPLTGKVGPVGLLGLPLTGSVTGIALPGGSQGGLAVSLVVNVDLSGRG